MPISIFRTGAGNSLIDNGSGLTVNLVENKPTSLLFVLGANSGYPVVNQCTGTEGALFSCRPSPAPFQYTQFTNPASNAYLYMSTDATPENSAVLQMFVHPEADCT